MSTFVETGEGEVQEAMKTFNLQALADAGSREDAEDSESLDQFGSEFPPIVEAPSPASRQRKATVKRKSPRHLQGQMNPFSTSPTPLGGKLKDDDTESHHSRRGEISAEVFSGKSKPYRRTVVEKGDNARALIRRAVDECMLFVDLSDRGRSEVVDAFSKITAVRGQHLIEEGEWGDLFYVLESGACDAMKVMFKPALNDKVPSKVMSYGPGGSFGEVGRRAGGRGAS
jgi:hypothetical protein